MKFSSILAIGALFTSGLTSPVPSEIAIRETDVAVREYVDIDSRAGPRRCELNRWGFEISSPWQKIHETPWAPCQKILDRLHETPNKIIRRKGYLHQANYGIMEHEECKISAQWYSEDMKEISYQDLIDVMTVVKRMSIPKRANTRVEGQCDGVGFGMNVHDKYNMDPDAPVG